LFGTLCSAGKNSRSELRKIAPTNSSGAVANPMTTSRPALGPSHDARTLACARMMATITDDDEGVEHQLREDAGGLRGRQPMPAAWR